MDLWRLRRHYRRLLPQLRRSRAATITELEHALLSSILLLERLESERAIVSYAQRRTAMRAREVVGWLRSATPEPNVGSPRLSRLKTVLAGTPLATQVDQVERDTLHLEQRADLLTARARAAFDEAARLIERLTLLTAQAPSSP